MASLLLSTWMELENTSTKQSAAFNWKVEILTCFLGIKSSNTDKWLLLVSVNAAENYKLYLIIVEVALSWDRYLLWNFVLRWCFSEYIKTMKCEYFTSIQTCSTNIGYILSFTFYVYSRANKFLFSWRYRKKLTTFL